MEKRLVILSWIVFVAGAIAVIALRPGDKWLISGLLFDVGGTLLLLNAARAILDIPVSWATIAAGSLLTALACIPELAVPLVRDTLTAIVVLVLMFGGDLVYVSARRKRAK